VEFTVDGQRYSFHSSTGSNPPSYQKSDSVPVAYGRCVKGTDAAFWAAYLAPVTIGGWAWCSRRLGTDRVGRASPQNRHGLALALAEMYRPLALLTVQPTQPSP
jgi:hypothetical protein